MSEENEIVIRDEAPHDYFTMIPNILDVMGLSPQAVALYRRMKRRAGETGECHENTHNLAVGCRMSDGAVSNAKKELRSTTPPLIRIAKKRGPGGIYDEITITDIWQLNHDYHTGKSVHIVNALGESVHPMNAERSPGETKKIPFKKISTTINAGEIFQAYEHEVGLITAHIADEIESTIDAGTPLEWIKDAIHMAAENNARNWAYIRAILDRWMRDGRGAGKPQEKRGNGRTKTTTASAPKPATTQTDLEIAKRIKSGKFQPHA